jgi:hypothetical protein
VKAIPETPSAIRAEKFLKHLNRAQKHLALVNHLVPEGCRRAFADIDTRLTQIKRFTEAGGQLR